MEGILPAFLRLTEGKMNRKKAKEKEREKWTWVQEGTNAPPVCMRTMWLCLQQGPLGA